VDSDKVSCSPCGARTLTLPTEPSWSIRACTRVGRPGQRHETVGAAPNSSSVATQTLREKLLARKPNPDGLVFPAPSDFPYKLRMDGTCQCADHAISAEALNIE